ncbi:CHAD domain-containing protein, partial [Campylobacter sp. MOP51]|uniref:CHAD domain-containing protein n=1 Tax=Campylobacter canis TaxID=3378588 RepID=UPI003C69BB31
NEECANERFHAARIEIKRLRYLLEIFIDLYAIKSLEKAKERAKEIQEIFGDLQDRDIWLEILEQYLSNEFLNAQIPDKLQTKIYKQIYKLRDKI